MTSRSSTERLGDLSESVVFHVVSWVPFWVFLVRFWWGCGVLFLCSCCFEDTQLFALTYSPTFGNSQLKTKSFDDRLSLERARHELKKKVQPIYQELLHAASGRNASVERHDKRSTGAKKKSDCVDSL